MQTSGDNAPREREDRTVIEFARISQSSTREGG